MRPTARTLCAFSVYSFCFIGHRAVAQTTTPVDTAVKITGIKVTAAAEPPPAITPVQLLTLPITANVTATRIRQTVNLMDTEDAVKYLPSVFLRKRNNGDTQAVMGTRTWGVSSSARSLIFADGVPLTALVANNNTIGGPRWGLVSPVEIQRVDMMYGPFSAAYAGNSMGAVMEITTRMPEKFEGSIEQTQARQSFDLYGTKKSYGTSQTAATVGDRFDRFSFWASANYQDSHSQPLAYATAATFPNSTSGGYPAQNKLGAPANVLGATGLLHTAMMNGRVKAAYDITPSVRAAYNFGYWKNDADAAVETYLRVAVPPNSSATAAGSQQTYAGNAAFASGNYNLLETHTGHSVSIRSNRRRDVDFEIVGSTYRFNTDRQRTPTTAAASDTTFANAGRFAVLDGTGWSTADLKGIWHRGGPGAAHTVTFGVHGDRYRLFNPTYNAPDWRNGDSVTTIASEGDGKTRTYAVWAQDGWWMTPTVKLTVGGRYERWHAYDGFNSNGTTKVSQPNVDLTRFSPKGILAWTPTPQWAVTASMGKAYRFATPSELYQLVTTGTTFTSPNPNLKPDNVLAGELRLERKFSRATTQVALFQDDVHDAIISQFLPLVAGSTTLYSYASNVDHVRSRGLELAFATNGFLVHNLDVSGSVTWLDAKVVALAGAASATSAPGAAAGKFLPNIPDRRATFVTTYRPMQGLSLSVAGRYSGRTYTTLDNADVNPNTYQGFSEWFVADAKANINFDRHWALGLGVDNVLNRKYFLFHPFPQRTLVGNLRFGF